MTSQPNDVIISKLRYAELFYFNPKKPTKGRRGPEPVGHLTALLWPETTHVGCATVTTPIKQPPNTGKFYAVLNYSFIVYLSSCLSIIDIYCLSLYTSRKYTRTVRKGLEATRCKYYLLQPKADSRCHFKGQYCSTYNNWKGRNACVNAGYSNCMGLSKQSSCGCDKV